MKTIIPVILLWIGLSVCAVASEPASLVIEIMAKNEVLIEQTRVPPGAVLDVLKKVKENEPSVAVKIIAAKDSDLHTLAQVMDACRSAGISKFDLMTK